ncbi:MAG: hypothetical protein ACP6IS_07965 [Candidatus Asgardarchaeia archaeon]
MSKKLLTMTVLVLALLLMSSVSSPAFGNKNMIHVNTEYSYIAISVDSTGYLDLYVNAMDLLDANLSVFDIAPDSENYAMLTHLTLSIDPDSGVSLTVGYQGNVSTNTTYISWSLEIKDKITSYLGYALTNEQSSEVYDDSENVTYYIWEWDYSVSDEWTKVMDLVNQYVTNDLIKFFTFNSSWTFRGFTFFFGKSTLKPNATGTSIIECEGEIHVFSGEGTHEFNLQKILGYKEPPIGISYQLSIVLPGDARIDQSTVNAGNATILNIAESSVDVLVSDTQTIGEMSFTFSYNFSIPEESNGSQESNESEGTSSSGAEESASNLLQELLGGSGSLITVGGVIALAVVFMIVKSLIGKKTR